MELTAKWLRVALSGALVFSIVALPLSAEAQTAHKKVAKSHKKKHSTKAHSHKPHHKIAPAPMSKIEPMKAEPTPPPTQPVPSGPIAGHPYEERDWREFHADWNGQYSFSEGKYYYDQEHKYPAIIPNDFNSIASRFGGAAILNDDPTLVFSGDSGEPYPILEYNADRSKPEKRLKLKSAFFGRAYFWRDGARYDRKIVTNDKGVQCFQFVKHP